MGGRSLNDKAAAALAEARVTVIKATAQGVALDVVSSKPDPRTLTRAHYRTIIFVRDGGLHRECSCPAMKSCYHVRAAEMIWRPGPHEGSHR